jgi:hydroxyacylglutathione hydrolase
MIIDRVYSAGLAQVSYIVADDSTGDVAVIDPRRDVDVYLDWANHRSYRITAILETHVHADFVSGALDLHAATRAPIYASRLGDQQFEHRPLDDGDRVQVGSLELEARWTPGHTPEHVVFLLIDPVQRPEPVAMFSGDLLFVGEVGRPDLLGTEQTQRLAEHLYETFSSRLDELPDDVMVYPGHTGGSSCGKKIGDEPLTTLGQERLFNYALQQKDRESFISAVMNGMPKPPTYYPTLKKVNKAGPAPLASLETGTAMTADQVERAIQSGALLIDARSEDAFDKAHVQGSFYAGSQPDFVNWVGWFAPYDKPIVLLMERDEDFEQYRRDLHRIGIDSVVGFLSGGITAWKKSGRSALSLGTISPAALRSSLSQGNNIAVVDVRTDAEWNEGHIRGAVHQFAGEITTGAEIDVDPNVPIALACATGYRSRVAASLLQARGYRNLVDLEGGMDAWNASGFPVEAA